MYARSSRSIEYGMLLKICDDRSKPASELDLGRDALLSSSFLLLLFASANILLFRASSMHATSTWLSLRITLQSSHDAY